MRILEKKYNLLNYCDVYSSGDNLTKRLNVIDDLPTETYTTTATESSLYPSGSGVFSVKLLLDLGSIDLNAIKDPDVKTFLTTNQYKANTLMVTGNYVDKMGYDGLTGYAHRINTADSHDQGGLSTPSTAQWTGSLISPTNISSDPNTTAKNSIKENISLAIFDTLSEGHQYVELELLFVDSTKTGETEIEVEISNIFFGMALDLENNGIDQKTFVYALMDNSKTSTNTNGQRFTTEYASQKKISGSINLVNSDEMDYLLNVFRDNGTHTPVGIILDEDEKMSISDSLIKFSGLFYINKDFSFKMIAPDYFSMAFDISQAV